MQYPIQNTYFLDNDKTNTCVYIKTAIVQFNHAMTGDCWQNIEINYINLFYILNSYKVIQCKGIVTIVHVCPHAFMQDNLCEYKLYLCINIIILKFNVFMLHHVTYLISWHTSYYYFDLQYICVSSISTLLCIFIFNKRLKPYLLHCTLWFYLPSLLFWHNIFDHCIHC